MKKKTLIFIVVLLLVFGAGVVGSRAVMDYSRKAERYYDYMCNRTKIGITHAMICDLSHRIDAIPEGPQGPPGPTGPSLKVVDADGSAVGYLLEMFSGEWPTEYKPFVHVFNTELNLVLPVYYHNGQIARRSNSKALWRFDTLHYESADCTGDAYILHMSVPYYLVTMNGPGGSTAHFRADDYNDIKQNFHALSKNRPLYPGCEAVNATYTHAAKVHEIDPPSFVGPLRIIED